MGSISIWAIHVKFGLMILVGIFEERIFCESCVLHTEDLQKLQLCCWNQLMVWVLRYWQIFSFGFNLGSTNTDPLLQTALNPFFNIWSIL